MAHGNADVKRGFSTNALLVTPAKASFSPASIVALRTIKDALCTVGSNLLQAPITLSSCFIMFKMLMSVIKQKKRMKLENQNRKPLNFNWLIKLLMKRILRLKNLKNLRRKTNELTVVQQLLSEGNSKLTDALKKKDKAQVVVAQAMLSSALSKLSITQTKLTGIMAEFHNVKRPAEHESVDQRSKKQTANTTENSTRESATYVLSKSKIPAAGESSKSDTKKPAVSRSYGTVPAAKK